MLDSAVGEVRGAGTGTGAGAVLWMMKFVTTCQAVQWL
jgi:hypothetical protein